MTARMNIGPQANSEHIRQTWNKPPGSFVDTSRADASRSAR